MARDEEIERRLQNWARWRVSQGRGALGFASVDFTTIGEGGQVHEGSAIPMWDLEAGKTEEAVKLLPSPLRYAVELHYVHPGSQKKKAAKACITERGLRLRVEEAHRLLSSHFAAKGDRVEAERQRVESLQRTAARR